MKRIITCSDGTWNRPNVTEEGVAIRTNVQKIFAAINKIDKSGGKNIYQLKYYDEGVGAKGNMLKRFFNGATGKGIDDNILNAYKFIIWNYDPGDELYIFGFSRGAYTARSLAGLIRNCGILKDNNLDLINEAYSIYRNRTSPDYAPEGIVAKKFREQYAYPFDKNNFRIKLVGVWDTVGSLGIPLAWFQFYNKMKYAFYDTKLSSMIEYAYHALAVDEKRGNFKPTLWEESDNKIVPGDHIQQTVEQRWFAGVHSNIGGGYADEGLSDITLSWMITKAKALGLSFDADYMNNCIKPDAAGVLYDSDAFPFCLTKNYIRPIEGTTNYQQVIDDSVCERM